MRVLEAEETVSDSDTRLALRLLRDWDFHMDRDSVGAAVYEV